MTTENRSKLLPFALTAVILVADQISKALVVAHVVPGTIGWSALGDFFWLIHAKNLGIAFSMGTGLPAFVRVLLFIGLPLVLMAGIVVYSLKTAELDRFQRWMLAGIVGGGVGNQIDRIFRSEGVVDFLSFKFWGIFGMERFPTFNVADSSISVCAVLLAAATIIVDLRKKP